MNKPFRSNRALQLMVAWLLVLWAVTAINPLIPRDWFLENLLVFFWGTMLLVTYRYFRFSTLSYALFTLFLSLHLTGAHYTYEKTPFGYWMQDWFGFERNHYDRVVHFSFGLLIAYPLRELLLRAAGVRRCWSYLLSVVVVLAFSALYEIVEFIAVMIITPKVGSTYLGMQGDEWDAQKDTLLAFGGAAVAMAIAGAVARTFATAAGELNGSCTNTKKEHLNKS